jgi:hypothetical protein
MDALGFSVTGGQCPLGAEDFLKGYWCPLTPEARDVLAERLEARIADSANISEPSTAFALATLSQLLSGNLTTGEDRLRVWTPSPSRVLKTGIYYDDPRSTYAPQLRAEGFRRKDLSDPEQRARVQKRAAEIALASDANTWAAFAQPPILAEFIEHFGDQHTQERELGHRVHASRLLAGLRVDLDYILLDHFGITPEDVETLREIESQAGPFTLRNHPAYHTLARMDYG